MTHDAKSYQILGRAITEAEGSAKTLRRVQVKLNRGGFEIRARESVTRPSPADEEIQFDPDNCEVSAKAHPYPYEARVTESGGTLEYREDFSDPQTGWPNHSGSRYVSGGYELSSDLPAQLSNGEIIDRWRSAGGALAAYGPWWDKLRASVYVDAGWAKMRSPTQMGSSQCTVRGQSTFSFSVSLI